MFVDLGFLTHKEWNEGHASQWEQPEQRPRGWERAGSQEPQGIKVRERNGR